MRTIDVKEALFESGRPSMREISEYLDKRDESWPVEIINWESFSYKPSVRFKIAWKDTSIYLKYYVSEDYFKAEKTETNQMVCEDSCVEFFVSPEDDGTYYNIEFNAIGTCLMGFGTGRADSRRADPRIVSKIRRLTSRPGMPEKEKKGKTEWTITAEIPADVFFRHSISSLRGKTFRANFYKCGDKLSVPHYLTWSPVGTKEPDYHQPGFFGTLRFM